MMACNPTRILLSNSATTTMTVTLATDPGDGTTVAFQVDGLGITDTETTTSAVAVFTITANTAGNNSLWDATLQVGTNTAVEAVVQAVETNAAQAIGVTLSSTDVTYCSPLGGGTVTSITPAGDDGSGTAITGAGTITVAATAPISTSVSGTTITVTHDTPDALGTATSFPASIVVNSTGHVTSVGSATTPLLPANNLSDVTASTARTNLGVTNVGSYTGQIETVADKTYTLDPGAATARTITGFYIKSTSGTVTATLKNGADTVKAASVTDATGDQTSLANTSVLANGVLTLVTSSNSTALDVIFAVEYTV